MPVTHLAATNYDERLSDEVELYQRTYMTLLRSSGETRLRVLESSHKAMGSSLHGLADSDQIDLGAFIYAVRRLPDAIAGAAVVVLGNRARGLHRGGLRGHGLVRGRSARRRRQWFDGGEGTLAVLIASLSDVDDLIPTLVAHQIEWNKIRQRLRARCRAPRCSTRRRPAPIGLGGAIEDWARLAEAWGADFSARMALCREHKSRLRVRMLGASNVGYARLTPEVWSPVEATLRHEGLDDDAPLYFVSSNAHSLINIATGIAREKEDELVEYVDTQLPDDDILTEELRRFRAGNPVAPGRTSSTSPPAVTGALHAAERRELERTHGVSHLKSTNALRVSSQIMPLRSSDRRRTGPAHRARVGRRRLSRSNAVIVNIDYPLGLAAYNILREVAVDSAALRGVYILGKAATLNADVGDVMISNVVYDEHSKSTYWLDNAFSVSDLSADLRFGTGLDNQRAVTVKSTFLQNRSYLDFYYREAFTVVEMEAGPFWFGRVRAGGPGTPPRRSGGGQLLQAPHRPWGHPLRLRHPLQPRPHPRGPRLDYYGMDSTYASSLAILRRILTPGGRHPGPAGTGGGRGPRRSEVRVFRGTLSS